MKSSLAAIVIPTTVAVVGILALAGWASNPRTLPLAPRLPRMDGVPETPAGKAAQRPVASEPTRGPGLPSKIMASWPWFRGPDLDAVGKGPPVRLARKWPAQGPKRLWTVSLGEGYAAAAVHGGCVYVLDHVHDGPLDLLRGLCEADRRQLAAALESITPQELPRAEAVLRRLFPVQESTAADGRPGVTRVQYAALEQSLGQWLGQQRGALLAGLRKDALDELDRSADTMRCFSLDDGREIWRNGYPVIVPPHHGMSRTVPAVIHDCVVSLGPLCQVAGWDAASGRSRWLIDLALDHGATVPPWYAGQCPLIDTKTDRLVLASGGKSLLMAVDYRTGKVLWESPNPRAWAMTHVSIVPLEYAGRRMYVYCGKGGVAGVDAQDGRLLWETTDWQIGTATCPTPVVVGPGRIFFSGGYNAGSLMLQLAEEEGRIVPRTLFRLSAKQFGSEQQTPVFWQGHLYGVRQKDQQLVCLDLTGRERWNSGRDKFGSAPYMVADGLLYALDDDGVLTMAEAAPDAYRRLARATVIEDGVTSWGPMALAAGRLIVRDFTRMVCLDVAEQKP